MAIFPKPKKNLVGDRSRVPPSRKNKAANNLMVQAKVDRMFFLSVKSSAFAALMVCTNKSYKTQIVKENIDEFPESVVQMWP